MGLRRKIVVASLVAAVVSGGAISARVDRADAYVGDPVVIVAGTFAGQPLANIFYAPLAARLHADGRRAFIFGLPSSGLGDAAQAAAELNAFVDGVRAQTGAAKVDLIGHSQGGMVSRYYIKYLGGANEVDSMISLGAVHYGTLAANAAALLGVGNCLGIIACQQMSIGSTFLNDLNAGDDTIGNVQYTNFVTALDIVIVPYTNGYLSNDGNNKNVTIQSSCWLRYVDHVTLPLDGTVYSGIQDALAKRAVWLNCFAL